MDLFYDDILSSSDDENGVEVHRRPRGINERIDYFQTLDDLDFITRFRLSKHSVEALLLEIVPNLQHATERNHAITPRVQLLLALRYYATGSFLNYVGDFAGVSKTSAYRILHRVTAAIASLARDVIKLPITAAEKTAVQVDFYRIARFPRVISALDCTHVKVQSFGGDDAEEFRNRKGYFSINVQAACDSHLKFTNIVARWPGRAHDSTIFRNSRLHARLEAGEFEDGLILGDGGYPLKPYLITPIQNPQTDAERLFNESQIRTRNTIGRTFGVWKRRFPCLVTGMRFSVDHVLPVIVATAVLHNKARTAAEPMLPDDPNLNIRWDVILNENIHNHGDAEPDARDTRALLIQYFESL